MPHPGPAQGISAAARAAWGFDRSDLAPHPAVRFGVLANGMRYALMRNAVPRGAMSVRLRFDIGASDEGKKERGFAHLLEHLIFHGTPKIPEGSLPLMLAHRGMRHWSDMNAFTSYDETVYRLDLMRADAPARDAALMVMREIGSNLLFTKAVVEGAKRKVREEIRARDLVQDRITTAQNAFFAPGSAIARGPVAGTVSEIGRATPAGLRSLYQRHYLPSRATLIVVGDFAPNAVEAEIAARFSDWRARDAAPPDPPSPSIPRRTSTEAKLFVHPKAPTSVTIAVAEPLGGGDAGRRRDVQFLQHLAAEMLNRRFARIATGGAPPFAEANLAVYDHFATVRLARIELAAKERDWRAALTAGARELTRAFRDGFSQEELDEQLSYSRRSLARAAAPRTTGALADAIVDAVGRGIVFTEPAEPAATQAYLARIRLEDVNAAFRAAWEGKGRLIFVTHNKRVPKGEAAILSAFAAAAE